jgi:hypothetical protein
VRLDLREMAVSNEMTSDKEEDGGRGHSAPTLNELGNGKEEEEDDVIL